jgi:creatinine amidohydrolase/Fe(II)-dependent formamide hydrolase-like protein
LYYLNLAASIPAAAHPSNTRLNFINYWNLMNDFDHAGEIETSLLLAINTKLVKMKMAHANTKELGGSKVA